ncbi:MAG: NADP-dependent malic enzyme [Candidatus Pacebacteria bacterium]|nr:NADP-dependent malic enzyme [Candidatus Paceibacterota bacterium]MBP9866888.1 NADP-dependent malic enzyme [Candidatus Paceibacterota bacterium]
MNHDYNKESLELHGKYHGKIGLITKVPMNDRDDLSRAYTPGVAEVCKEISRDPTLARDYTLKRNTVAIISDGSAILGLGNLGPLAAIPVMEGKAAILKSFANVDAFPICLDTQDTEEIIKAVKQLAPVFGAVNLEDISAPRCFEIEERLRRELSIPVMHDDQWGTATVVLGGLINALKVTNRNEGKDIKIVVNGVGSAGVAISRLLLSYGFHNMLFCDSQGIIHDKRGGLNKEKIELISKSSLQGMIGTLEDAIQGADVFVGVSKAGALTKEMAQSMNKDAIVFALANPIPEIMPEIAKEAGVAVIATGRSDFPNQLNNSLIFPGLFKGMLDAHCKQFEIAMFTKAALALAGHVKNPTQDAILPNMFDKELVNVIASTVS